MKVDIHSLGVFSQLAREGSHHAADSLSQMTGLEIYVDVTNITLLSHEDLVESFGDDEFVGVQIGFEGQFEGETVLVFQREAIGTVLELLLPGSTDNGMDEFARSGVREVGNIMMSGFIDGWANHLDTVIDITPPTYVEQRGVDIFPEQALTDDVEDVFLFESQLETLERDVKFYIYMFPEYDAMTNLMASNREADDAIPVDKLAVFNRMTKRGAEGAAANVTGMTGIDTEVDVSRLSFVPIEDVPNHVGDEQFAGVVLGFKGLPSGYLLILFDEDSARIVARSLIPIEQDVETGGLTEMEQSAIKELGNIMTSGFIDGWANVLQTSIDHTPPQFVHDIGSSIMSPIVGRLGQKQDYAFMIDSTVKTAGEQFSCDLYALPNEAELGRALKALDVDRADKTQADANQFF